MKDPFSDEPFRVVVCDTETTGLDEKTARVIEAAFLVCSYANGVYIVQKYASLFYPDGPVAPDFEDPDIKKALEVNCITPEALRNSPTFKQWWPSVLPIVRDIKIWVAHNSGFDRKMLKAEFKRLPPEMHPGPRDSFLCTMRIDTAMHKGYGFKRNLRATAERWKVPTDNLHRASDDAEACWEIFKAQRLQARTLENLKRLHNEGDEIWKSIDAKREARKAADQERSQAPADASPQVAEQTSS
jgi:DNA polymerase III epsilon subunit-like protein